ncbi:hypothetical protein MTO96_006852 [Rhipicephalus appendiculatus]
MPRTRAQPPLKTFGQDEGFGERQGWLHSSNCAARSSKPRASEIFSLLVHGSFSGAFPSPRMEPFPLRLSPSPKTSFQPNSPHESPLQRSTIAVCSLIMSTSISTGAASRFPHETFNLNGGCFVFSPVGEKRESAVLRYPLSPRSPSRPRVVQERKNEGNRFPTSLPASFPHFSSRRPQFRFPLIFSLVAAPLSYLFLLTALVCQSQRQCEVAPVKAFSRFPVSGGKDSTLVFGEHGKKAVGNWQRQEDREKN